MTTAAHHIGITVDDLETMTAFYRDTLGFDVEAWHDQLVEAGVAVTSEPVDFGTTPRFYCHDPEGNVVELLASE